MRGEVVQKLGVDVASQRERSLCTCVARGGQCQLQPQCPCLCVHRRDKGITVLWVMDLEYTISTHSSLFILCCQGHRKPLHYLYISLLLRLGLSFSLLPSGWPRRPPHPAESGRASEWMCLRVAAASAWSEKQNGWECIVRLSFSWSAAAVSLHKILNCFHHIKAVLSYCWHMAWKAASGLFWKGENWTQRLFEVGREAFLKLNIPMTV